MKILYVLEHYYPYVGGAEKLFKMLAESHVQNGNQAIVITTRFHKKLKRIETINGVRIIRLNISNRFLFTFLSVGAIIKQCKECDFIHTTSYNAALPAFIAGKLRKKKIIITFHEIVDKLWFKVPFLSIPSKFFNYLYEKFILLLPFNYFIAVSEYTKTGLLNHNIPEHKIMKIYNGIEYNTLPLIRRTPEERFTYTYFGRLGVSKGLDILLKAATVFNKNHPDAHLKLIIPKVPVRFLRKFLRQIRKQNLQNQTTIIHSLPKQKLYKELKNSSCIVIPSYSEGFCFAAVEALGLEIPIISSGTGALKEVISGNHIVMETLSSQSLIHALEKAKEKRWNNMPLKKFIWEEQYLLYEELYNNLVTKHIVCTCRS